jgi:hypothetical protein
MINMPWEVTRADRRLPNSTQVFSFVLVATALTIVLAAYTQPVIAVHNDSHRGPVLIVGQLAQCSNTLSWQQLITDAHSQIQGDTARPGQLSSATGVVHVGCSLHLPAAAHKYSPDTQKPAVAGSWQSGPYLPGQHVHVSGLDALDCLVHGEASSSGAAQAPYVFLLKPIGVFRTHRMRCHSEWLSAVSTVCMFVLRCHAMGDKHNKRSSNSK